MGQIQNFELKLKPSYGKLRNQLYSLNVIQSEHYDDEGNLHLSVIIAPQKIEQMIKKLHLPLDEILGEKSNIFRPKLEEFEIPDSPLHHIPTPLCLLWLRFPLQIHP